MIEKEVDELKLNLDKALEHREKAEYKLAIEALYKALDVESDNIEVLTQLAEIYSIMNDIERSIRYYKDILEIDENNEIALSALYNKYFSIGKYKDALEYAQTLVKLSPCDKNYSRLVAVYDKFADVAALKTLVQQNRLSSDVLLKIAAAYVNHAFVDEALKLLEHIEPCEEKSALQALIYFNKNDLAAAREIVMPLKIETVDVLNLKGLFYIEDMKFLEAIKCFSKAVSLEPAEPKFYFNLANAYFYNGWMEEAVIAYRKAIELDVTNVDYRYALANLYFEIKDYEQARFEVTSIFHIEPEHYDTKVLNALLKYAGKDYLGAKADLEEALKLKPDDTYVLTSLARVLIDLNLYDKAEDLILNVIARDSENPKSLCVLADLFARQKKFSDSLELVDKILCNSKFYMPAYAVGMKAAFDSDNLDLAKKYAQDALSVEINFAPAYYYLALISKKHFDIEEAIECLKRAIMHDLTNPEYYAEMARTYMEDDDIKSALEYANEAITIDSSSAEYMMLYSDLAAKNRKFAN